MAQATAINSARRISILPVLMVNFIGMLGYSIIMPFLVFLVKDFGGNAFIYGLMGSIYPAFQFIGAPILGRWSDSVGRRRILLISQVGTFIAWVIFFIALVTPAIPLTSGEWGEMGAYSITIPLLMLFFARALDGITGGNVSVANAYLSDISNDGNRKANFGKMAMSASLGFIIGPAIAGLLGATVYEEKLPVIAAAAVSAFAMYLIYYYLPESKTDLVQPHLEKFSIKKLFTFEQKECYEVDKCPDKGLKAVWKIPNMPQMLAIYFLTFLAFSFFYAGLPMHALEHLGWNSFQLGVFFSTLSGMMILVQGPLLSWLSRYFDDAPLVIVGCTLLILNFLFMTSMDSRVLYFAALLYALGNGLMWPSFLSILSKVGGSEQQGAVQGIANSSGSLASIFGLIGGGFLFNFWGSQTFIITAVVLLVVLLLSFRLITLEKVLKKE